MLLKLLLAKTYEEELNDPKRPKVIMKKLFLNTEDSIYYNEARKKYRQLRGDAIN